MILRLGVFELFQAVIIFIPPILVITYLIRWIRESKGSPKKNSFLYICILFVFITVFVWHFVNVFSIWSPSKTHLWYGI